jgi:uncharacterized protein YegP (UPF0339 family)
MDNSEVAMPGRFEFYKDKSDRRFYFRLLAADGEVVLSSEAYSSKLGCTKGIQSVRANAANPDNYLKEPTGNGGHRFKLLSLNGRILGISQSYDTAAAYSKAVVSVSRLARAATVDELT